jgi:REP element-mobilizing transposase RayT
MTDQPPPPRRKPIRHELRDYAEPGIYFVTICTWNRACLFGRVIDGSMSLSALGQAAHEAWLDIPTHHPGVEIDGFVVMPNHVHGILRIGAAPSRGPSGRGVSLGTIVGSYKASVSRRGGGAQRVWQRGYYDHIVRDDRALERIRAYIAANPANWAEDAENPLARSDDGSVHERGTAYGRLADVTGRTRQVARRRARQASPLQNGGLPGSQRRARQASPLQDGGLPGSQRRARQASPLQDGGLPGSQRRARQASPLQDGGLPGSQRRAGQASPLQGGGLPGPSGLDDSRAERGRPAKSAHVGPRSATTHRPPRETP